MLSIHIDNTGAAFDADPLHETARVLREIADRMSAGDLPVRAYDINGNACGRIEADYDQIMSHYEQKEHTQ